MSGNQNSNNSSPEIVKMFRESVAPYSKKMLALHPHLYGSLYRRASEIQALDKILSHLELAQVDAKAQRYTTLVPILAAIKDALHGQPPLSWWNLFTSTMGYALRGSKEVERNEEEVRYLKSISDILTSIIRNFQSINTKLLLDIRLTTLEVDARLLELESIPEGVKTVNETYEYLRSEFNLLTQELSEVSLLPKESWNKDSGTLYLFLEKVNNLMNILTNVQHTDLQTYTRFNHQGDESKLESSVEKILQGFDFTHASPDLEEENKANIEILMTLFTYFPKQIHCLRPTILNTLLQRLERLFFEDPTLGKIRPQIFFSAVLKEYVLKFSLQLKERFEYVREVIKGLKVDPSIKRKPEETYKNSFKEENDLYNLCTLIHFKKNDPQASTCDPTSIQKEILNRMVLLTNLAQPKELDAILKSFSEDEKENRYFLVQEVILEQFIRWRKLGIY